MSRRIPKPHIEDLYEAFCEFQNATHAAVQYQNPGVWGVKLKEAREEFKAKCEEMGIATAIDWSER